VVTKALSFQSTVAPSAKFAPSTVSVKPALPAVVLTGDKAVIVGTPVAVPLTAMTG
jgi:hypothetical protein